MSIKLMMKKIIQNSVNTTKSTVCRSCQEPIHDFIDFGEVPLAGAFLKPNATEESLFQMNVSFCPNCSLVQIPNIIPKEILFHGDYHYFSSVTSTLNLHFDKYAEYITKLLSKKDSPFVIEFGCNDGVLLSKLQKRNIKHLGIDASQNVVNYAKKQGLNATCGFFNPDIIPNLALDKKPDVITGSNVFAHNNDIHQILEAVQQLLSPEGYFIVEVHYLLNLIQENQFDFFYHEHCNYYSVTALQYLLGQYGLEIVDLTLTEMHGGSLRVVSQFKSLNVTPSNQVKQFLDNEIIYGLNKLETYQNFTQQIDALRQELIQALKARKKEGKKIFAYGASGRAVTFLDYMGIGAEILDFIIDDSPARANHIMPGVHIPIKFADRKEIEETDCCLITAWSYSNEIMNKLSYYLDGHREFIIPLPQVSIIK